MAVLSTLRSAGRKPQKKKVSFFSTLKKYLLCYPKCKDEDKLPDLFDIEDDDVSVISLNDTADRWAQLQNPGVGIPAECKKNLTAFSATSMKTLSLTNAHYKAAGVDNNPILPQSEKVFSKKTLLPLDPNFTKQAQSLLLDQALITGESSRKSQSFSNLNDNTFPNDEQKKICPELRSKLIKVAEVPITNQVPLKQKSKPLELKDDTSPTNNQTNISEAPKPKLIRVAEAPIANCVPFQSKPSYKNNKQLKLTSQEDEQWERKTITKPEPIINVAPAPVKKRVRFQLPPSIRIIPSRHFNKVALPPPHPWVSNVLQQLLETPDCTSVLRKQEADTLQRANERSRATHHLRIRSTITSTHCQEHVPYNQNNNKRVSELKNSHPTLSRPLTKRGLLDIITLQ